METAEAGISIPVTAAHDSFTPAFTNPGSDFTTLIIGNALRSNSRVVPSNGSTRAYRNRTINNRIPHGQTWNESDVRMMSGPICIPEQQYRQPFFLDRINHRCSHHGTSSCPHGMGIVGFRVWCCSRVSAGRWRKNSTSPQSCLTASS